MQGWAHGYGEAGLMGTRVHMYKRTELCIQLVCSGCDKPQADHINNKHFFLPVLNTGKFKIEALADSVSGGSPPPAVQTPTFLLCPHLAGTVREKQGFCCLFF